MAESVALPDFFEPLLHEQYAQADVERIMAGCAVQRPVTLRANTLRSTRDEVAEALDEAGIFYKDVPWYGDAFIVEHVREKALWELPLYQQGKIYLQSLSSMIPALALDARPGEDICDMCAAPGGKTTQIAALTGNRSYITACEMHAPRAEKLQHNLQKLGAPNVTVMKVDARRMDDFFKFDRILLDAPCSGSGTLSVYDERMPKRFTQALVQKSRKSQAALLAKALAMLKPGATLVYSTCSVLACENEDIVEAALKQMRKRASFEVLPLVEPASQPGAQEASAGADEDSLAKPLFSSAQAETLPLLPTRIEGALCLAPTKLYEGFFVTKIRRIS